MKTKFALFSDMIFFALASFVIALVIFNYFCPYPFSITLSLIASLVVVLVFYKKKGQKNNEERLKKLQKQELEALINDLNFATRTERLAIFEKALDKNNLSHERTRGGISITGKNAIVYIKFGFDKLTKTDIVKIFNKLNKNENAYILSSEFDEEIKTFASRFDGRINLADGERFYTYLKKADCLPESKYFEFIEKKKKGDFKLLLEKRRSKTFFGFGLFFLFMSYFSPIKLYYVLFGCVFMIYAIFLRAFGKEVKEKN